MAVGKSPIFLNCLLSILVSDFASKTTAQASSKNVITLNGSYTFAEYSGLSVPKQDGSLSFLFRTEASEGMLLYQESSTTADYVAFILSGSQLSVSLDHGEREPKLLPPADFSPYADGKEHELMITRQQSGKLITINVDGKALTAYIHNGDDSSLDLDGLLYIGGFPPGFKPRHLSGKHRPFAMCFEPKTPSTGLLIRSKGTVGRCDWCEPSKCANTRRCLANRAEGCDCRGSGFGGLECRHEQVPVTFPGSRCSHFSLGESSPITSFPPDISFRLKDLTQEAATVFDSAGLVIRLANGVVIAEEKAPGSGVKELKRVTVLNPLAWLKFSVSKDNLTIGNTVSLGCSLDKDQILAACVQHFSIGKHISLTDYLMRPDLQGSILPGVSVTDVSTDDQAYEQCYDLKRLFESPIQFPYGKGSVQAASYAGLALFISFRTAEKHGLLAFAPGKKGSDDFVATFLECGYPVLLYNSGNGRRRLRVSRYVSDAEFHELRIIQEGCTATVYIDGDSGYTEYPPDFTPSDECGLELDGALYLGGTQAAAPLPDGLEPVMGFKGCLRGLFKDANDADLTILVDNGQTEVQQGCGTSSCSVGYCGTGQCTNEITGPQCDCFATEGLVGKTCSTPTVVATFPGNAILEHALPTASCTPCADNEISIHIRPAEPTGTLFFLNGITSSLLVELIDGSINLVLNNETTLSTSGKLSINKWHKIRLTFTSRLSAVWFEVDGNAKVKLPIAEGNTTQCLNGKLIVGGYKHMHASPLPGSKSSSHFKGCIRGFVINGRRPLLEAESGLEPKNRGLARYKHPLLGASCENRLLSCDSGEEMLFVAHPSAVTLNRWGFTSKGQIKLTLRTDFPNGLVVSSYGAEHYLYVQVENGRLCAYIKLDTTKSVCVGENLDDGSERNVTITKVHHSLTLSVNTEEGTIDLGPPEKPKLSHLDLDELSFGRQDGTCHNSTVSPPSPSNLQEGFRGCLTNLAINGLCTANKRHFACSSTTADANGQGGNIYDSCRQNWCDVNECRNNGQCVSALTESGCNCKGTGYRGDICTREATIITLNCNNKIVHHIAADDKLSKPQVSSETPALHFFYRSWWKAHEPRVELVTLRDENDEPMVVIEQDGDQILMSIKEPGMQDWEKAATESLPSLKDFEYHQVKLYFLEHETIELAVHRPLAVEPIRVTSLSYYGQPMVVRTIEWGQFSPGNFDSSGASSVPLCGHLKDVIYNNYDIIEKIEGSQSVPEIEHSVTVGELAFSGYHTFFRRKASYRSVEKSSGIARVEFYISTNHTEKSVLLDVFGTSSVTLELLSGQINMTYWPNDSSTGNTTTTAFPNRIDNSRWHELVLTISSAALTLSAKYAAGVFSSMLAVQGVKREHFQTVHIGGTSKQRSTKLGLASGYKGCISSMLIDNKFVNLHKAKSHRAPDPDDIRNSCPPCLLNNPGCENGGRCVDVSDRKCNCNGTGYKGDVCEIPIPTTAPPTTTPIPTTMPSATTPDSAASNTTTPATTATTATTTMAATTTATPNMTTPMMTPSTTPTTTVAIPAVTATPKPSTITNEAATTTGSPVESTQEQIGDGGGSSGGSSGGSGTLIVIIVIVLIILIIIVIIAIFAALHYKNRKSGHFSLNEGAKSPTSPSSVHGTV